MHQHDIDVVSAQFFAEAVQIGAHGGRVACPRFRKHSDFVALHMFDSFSNMRMTSIGIGRIKKPQAMVVSVQQQIGKPLYPERSLVRMMADTDGTGSHCQATGANTRAPERHRISCAEFLSKWRNSYRSIDEPGTEPCRANTISSCSNEFTALHTNLFGF